MAETKTKTIKAAPKKVVKIKEKPVEKKTKGASLSLDVFGKDGKVVGKIERPKEIFGAKISKDLMAQAVRVYLANQRIGGAHTKTRGEVKGSTRKIYRQKGTGRARHGAITAPIFVGGGIAFGPRKRDFGLEMPKMMRRRALFSALTSKLNEGKIFVFDASEVSGKTKEVFQFLKSLNLINKKSKILFVSSDAEKVEKAARNVPGLNLVQANTLNTYLVVNSNCLVLVKEAVGKMKENYLKEKN